MRLTAPAAAALLDVLRAAPDALDGPLSAVVTGLLYASGRRMAEENLARAFPDWPPERRREVARGSYRQTARALLEVLHGSRRSDDEIRDRVCLDPDGLPEAVAAGDGVLLLSAHYGNWEWLARRVAAEGLPLTAVYKEPKDPDLGERLREARAGTGVEYVAHDDPRAQIRRLKDGQILGIVMDQEPRRAVDGAVVPLFGIPTRTHVAPFKLARLTGSRVVTAFCAATEPGRYRAAIEPFPLSDDPDPERAVATDAAAFNARLEAAVRESPEMWAWSYQRWKRIDRAAAARA